MRGFVLAALLVTLPLTAVAQETPEEAPSKFFMDIGPGFFTSLSDSSSSDSVDVSRSGITTFLGVGVHFGPKVALSARINMTQEGQRAVATSVWGWIQYSLTQAGKPGIYVAVGAGSDFGGDGLKFAGRGGYQIGLFGDGVMGFIEAEGRYVNTEEIESAAIGNAGLRTYF
jgi:hypothetical protein